MRTPICKARKGGFAGSKAEELLAAVLKAVLDKTRIDPKIVEDICVGNVLPPGGGATTARMAALFAGFPESTAISTTNRQCSSGLQAVANIVAAIKAGYIGVGIGAGVESMTQHYGPQALQMDISERLMHGPVPSVPDCLIPMGQTSENVAERWKISREAQDRFALVSHQKASRAQSMGWFKEEICPVTVFDGDGKASVIDADDGIRNGLQMEALNKLKPAFRDSGTTTAGNSSQVSDGAAAVLLMKRSTAEQLGMAVLGKFVGFSVVGVPPAVMGIGPAFAIPAVLKQTGLSLADISIFELNEAFASQAVYCVQKLGLDETKVNPAGGAIALGHPLGCTGARQIATLLAGLKRTGGQYGIVSMCIGTGMGAAAVIRSEQ